MLEDVRALARRFRYSFIELGENFAILLFDDPDLKCKIQISVEETEGVQIKVRPREVELEPKVLLNLTGEHVWAYDVAGYYATDRHEDQWDVIARVDALLEFVGETLKNAGIAS